MTVFVGDGWAEAHHDVHLMNEAGDKLVAKRLPQRLDGIAALYAMVADHAVDPDEVVVGIETERGLWVEALIDQGRVETRRPATQRRCQVSPKLPRHVTPHRCIGQETRRAGPPRPRPRPLRRHRPTGVLLHQRQPRLQNLLRPATSYG